MDGLSAIPTPRSCGLGEDGLAELLALLARVLDPDELFVGAVEVEKVTDEVGRASGGLDVRRVSACCTIGGGLGLPGWNAMGRRPRVKTRLWS
jgi:hypothetical protein